MRTCAKVRELPELQFGLVNGVGIVVLDWSPRCATGMGGFLGEGLFPHFTRTLLLVYFYN